MDAHYVSLPLGFLATAALNGFTGEGHPQERPPGARVEGAPVNRSVLHCDGWSVHVNLGPERGYDSFGIADLTLGLGRRLRFGGQAHYGRYDGEPIDLAGPGHSKAGRLAAGTPCTIGIARWLADGCVEAVSAMHPTGGCEAVSRRGHLEARARLADLDYELRVDVESDHLRVIEGVGDSAMCSLLVPYLYDRGDGLLTEVALLRNGAVLSAGEEVVEVTVGSPLGRVVHLPRTYECRYGFCGLLRFDLAEPGPVAYDLHRAR